MAEKIQLEVVTPERRVLAEPVDMVTVPGLGGELGILPGHTPLISQLQTGVLTYVQEGKSYPLHVSGGFVEVRDDHVSVLADMVLVSTIRQYLEEGVPLYDALRQAAERRLRPVLMTGLVASLGFVPMALHTGIGAEVQRPLATVVLGGVLSSMLLTLFVLPALYSAVAPRGAGKGAAA